MNVSNDQQKQQLFIPSAIVAWVFPGIGYFHRGEYLRGGFVMFSVITLILVGVMVGGLQVCDGSRNPVAGLVQKGSLVGVVLNVVAAKNRPEGMANDYAQIVVDNTGGRPEEVGLIFTSVAGFLNLMAVVGCMTPLPKEPEKEESENQSGGLAAKLAAEQGSKAL